MAITFNKLREATGGMVKTYINPSELREFKNFSDGMNNRMHPSMEHVFSDIEREINNFGYTLGEMDLTEPFEDSGEDKFFLLTSASQEIVKNIYLNLSWEKQSPKGQNGQVSINPMDTLSILHYQIVLKFIEVAPAELESMVDEYMSDSGDIDLEDPNTTSGDDENLDEAFRIQPVIGKTLTIMGEGSDGSLKFTIDTDGHITMTIENSNEDILSIEFNKAHSAAVMDAIQSHYMKFVK